MHPKLARTPSCSDAPESRHYAGSDRTAIHPGGGGWVSSITIALALALAVSCHFYAVLLWAPFVAAEFFQFVTARVFRLRTWLAFAAGAIPLLFWLPLIRPIREFNLENSLSPFYYAKPSLDALARSYDALFFSPAFSFVLVGLLSVFAVIHLWQLFRSSPSHDAEPPAGGTTFTPPEYVLALSFLLLPVAALIFSFLGTRTFNVRYVVAANLGFIVLAAAFLQRIKLAPRTMAVFALTALALACIYRWQFSNTNTVATRLTWTSVFTDAKVDSPVYMTDAASFIELWQNAPGLRQQVQLFAPPVDAGGADPTNMNIALRWKEISGLPVHDSNFLANRSTPFLFLARSSPQAFAVITWLHKHGATFTLVRMRRDATLYLVNPTGYAGTPPGPAK